MARQNKDSEDYVDNKEFFKAMKEHRRLILKAKRDKTEPPVVSDYIGDCIMRIAQRLSNKVNFINYPFKEEMISDGIENCLMYLNNFNPNKSKNPFAYFTQIIYFAFVRRIQKEKKHLYTKYKAIENAMTSDFYENVGEDGQVGAPSKYGSEYSDQYMREFIENFETHKNKKKAKSKKKKAVSLDKFFEEKSTNE